MTLTDIDYYLKISKMRQGIFGKLQSLISEKKLKTAQFFFRFFHRKMCTYCTKNYNDDTDLSLILFYLRY